MNETIANKLQTIAENELKVFDAGKKAEHDHFWGVFQQYGERTNYQQGFFTFRNTANFYPKYDVAPTGNAMSMMMYFGISDDEPIDLAARLEECGVRLDMSKVTNMQQAFYWRLGVTRLPEISMESATNTQSCICNNIHLVTIDKIIFSNDGTQPSHDNLLGSNPNLKNVTVEGVIGKSLNLIGTYNLSTDSMKSIILHLKNYAGTDGEFANKLTLAVDAWTRLEADSISPTGTTWKEYVGTLGWNT